MQILHKKLLKQFVIKIEPVVVILYSGDFIQLNNQPYLTHLHTLICSIVTTSAA